MTNSYRVVVGDLRPDQLQILGGSQSAEIIIGLPGHLSNHDAVSEAQEEPHRPFTRSAIFALRAQLFKLFKRRIDALPQSVEWHDAITRWLHALDLRTRRYFLATKQPIHTRLVIRDDETVVMHAPLTLHPATGEPELNLVLRGPEHRKAIAWFDDLRDQCDDITSDMRDALAGSWAGDALTPRVLYYRVLTQYFWATIEALDTRADDNPLVAQLTEFQLEAYHYAKGILRRYGGVFLADVVGLGKTFIALALLRHLQDRHGEHAVVIAPPNVLPAWEELAASFRVELQTVSLGKLEDLDRFTDREILVIDESHHFRNRGTLRYDRIQSWLRPSGGTATRKVVLLSATPQNNHPDDVRNQLALFPDNFNRLPFRGESLDAWFAQVKNGQAAMTELLQHVVVRRTRRFIQSAYPNATLRVKAGDGTTRLEPIRFPQRISGTEQCLRYQLEQTYGDELYKHTLTTLRSLTYAPYSLAEYLRPEAVHDERVAGIRRVGSSLRALFKVLVLKRLESSVVAFSVTLGRLHDRVVECLNRLERGAVGVRFRDDSPSSNVDEGDSLDSEEREVPASLFDVQRLRANLEADRSALMALRESLGDRSGADDGKLERLKAYLLERPPPEHKTIVFTQFAHTAEYLGRELASGFGRAEVVTGAKGGALKTARRFSPRSSRASIPAAEQLDLLISTDALSEGVNLQDADTLINYDIHWNPVRLIQRAGRIDRIGSANETVYIASFLPEAELESALGIEAVLRRRIREFLEVFGEDSRILPSDDMLDESDAVAAFTGDALEETDDDMDGVSRHIDRLLQLRREDPELFGRIVDLRPGRHALSSLEDGHVGATRLGWFWRFWHQRPGESLRELDDLAGLDRLFAHAEKGPSAVDAPARRIALGAFADEIRSAFQPIADAFREQRLAPRLSPGEAFILESLQAYSDTCVATRADHVRELIDWLGSGRAQAQLRRLGQRWKREKLPAEAIFQEVRVLFAQYPPVSEDLARIEVVGAVAGVRQDVND